MLTLSAPSRRLTAVLLLFTLGITIPTGFLVYLGVQSIRSETLLLRKESEERIGKTAQALREQAQGILDEAWAPWSTMNSHLSALASLTEAPLIPWVAEQRRRTSGVGLMILAAPDLKLLYPQQESSPRDYPMPALSAALRDRSQKAESLEFQQKDYAAAQSVYQELEESVGISPRWKAAFLMSQAGCLMKQKRWDTAQATYQELSTRYGSERDAQGYPVGLVVRLQQAELQAARGRRDLATADLLTLFEELNQGRWALEADVREFLVRRIQDRLTSWPGGLSVSEQTRWQSLQYEWMRSQQDIVSSRRFMKDRWPGLQSQLRKENRSGQSFVLFPEGDVSKAIVYVPLYAGNGALRAFWVAERDLRPLFSRIQRTLEDLADASSLAYRFELESKGLVSESISKPTGDRWPWVERLSRTSPVFLLRAAPVSDIPVQRAAEKRRRVYLAMVMLAAGVIVMALFATGYALRREMEVAQLKARFVASISHELKTPLSIIGLIGQKLKLGRYSSESEAQEFYGMLTEETGRLKSLIDEVLDFSRLMENRQPYHKEPTDLVDWLRDTVERFRQSQPPDHLTLSFESRAATCVRAIDREALGRAVLNLLENAVKYSPLDRKHVSVVLSESNGEAVIDVQDQGVGIPLEDQPHVFERFYRGRTVAEAQPVPGAGLGLSIVSHIVDAHGGKILLQSEPGKGSMFSIRLPKESSHA